MKKTAQDQVIIYEDRIEARFEGETVWLTIEQMAELFDKDRTVINKHILNIYKEGELVEASSMRKVQKLHLSANSPETPILSNLSSRKPNLYNLDVIISVGYRVKSIQGTRFRQWATARLREYIVKGFALDSDRLKSIGGGGYWRELLDKIRDIRSSEKVLYRQVLDLYATAVDYDPKSEISSEFFKIVQNKLHFAAHGQTAAEVVYMRVDSDKPYAGLTHFKGKEPTQAEALVAKNFLKLDELKILNNLVSAYFDLAEINAMEQKPMRMADYIRELDNILTSTKRKVLDNAGKISREEADKKAKTEYKKYKAKTLSEVEKSYLESIKSVEKKVAKKVKSKK